MFLKLVLSYSLYILIPFSKNTLPQTFQCHGLKGHLFRESFSNQPVELSTPGSFLLCIHLNCHQPPSTNVRSMRTETSSAPMPRMVHTVGTLKMTLKKGMTLLFYKGSNS